MQNSQSLNRAPGGLLESMNNLGLTRRRKDAQAELPLIDNNPKTAAGQAKPKLSSIPPVPLFYIGMVMNAGKAKYGLFNWRHEPITTSTYTDALFRHLLSFIDGETIDPESGAPHMAHVAANAIIVMDAMHHSVLIDDRTTAPGGAGAFVRNAAGG